MLLYVCEERPGIRDNITPTTIYLVFVYANEMSSGLGSYPVIVFAYFADQTFNGILQKRFVLGKEAPHSSVLQIQVPVVITDSMLNHRARLTGKQVWLSSTPVGNFDLDPLRVCFLRTIPGWPHYFQTYDSAKIEIAMRADISFSTATRAPQRGYHSGHFSRRSFCLRFRFRD